MLSARDLSVLKLLRRYYYARARQIQMRLIPGDKDCSITRSILRRLLGFGLLRKFQPKVIDPLSMNNSAAPIYTITLKGASVLVELTNDASYFLRHEPGFSQWLSMNHYCALTSLHMVIDDAIAAQSFVKMTKLYFEHEVINPDAKDGSKYKLHMRVSRVGEKAIFCIPDSAIETEAGNARRGWLVEYQTVEGDHPKRVFAKKHQGYDRLEERELWKRIFANASDFRVLCICAGGPAWRDALREEFAKNEKGEKWGFIASRDVTVEKFLFEPIVYSVKTDKPSSLFKKLT